MRNGKDPDRRECANPFRQMDVLPITLLRIATDVLRAEGAIRYIDNEWIAINVYIQRSTS